MDFKTFTAQYFNGDEEKAQRHLVNEGYYHDYSLTGSGENLQKILDTMTREEAKVYMRFFREAIKKDPGQARKNNAPLMDILRGTDSSWQFDEAFIRRGNPFGKEIKKNLLLALVGITILGALLLLGKKLGFSESVFHWFAVFCASFAAVMAGRIISAVSNYRMFKRAEKTLQESEVQSDAVE